MFSHFVLLFVGDLKNEGFFIGEKWIFKKKKRKLLIFVEFTV